MTKKSKTEVLTEDKEEFEETIFFKKDSKINVLCSFTYITPNYDVLATLSELYKFTQGINSHIFLVMWDMNTLANPYFKKYCSNVKDQEKFIEQKMQEVKGIAKAIGFDEKNFSIYKSSELWKRLVSFKEENLFQQFFSVLARLRVQDFSDFRKCSHIFQIALDFFFSNYFSKLYQEDMDEEIDLIFSDVYKKKLYLATRQIMLEEGIIKHKPSFLIMEDVPYLVFDERVPEWNMKLEEIKAILMKAQNKNSEFIQVLKYLDEDISIDKLNSKKEIVEALSKELYKYLSKYKKLYFEKSGEVEESITNITDSKEAEKFGHILLSKIFLDILVLSDGTKNTTEIAKQLKKSVPTISAYSAKLKKLGYLRAEKGGNLKRNLKGVRINFDSFSEPL